MSELLTVKMAAARARVSRSALYPRIMSGEIESVKIGALRRIPADALDRWVQRMLEVQAAGEVKDAA